MYLLYLVLCGTKNAGAVCDRVWFPHLEPTTALMGSCSFSASANFRLCTPPLTSFRSRSADRKNSSE